MRKLDLPILPSPIEIDENHPPWLVARKHKICQTQIAVDQAFLMELTDQLLDFALPLPSLGEGRDHRLVHRINLLHRHCVPPSVQLLEPGYPRSKFLFGAEFV